MVVHINSVAFNGIDVVDVDVQVQLSPGIPTFNIVGLGDKAVSESKERVKAAIISMGLTLPSGKILVNLAPADLVKEGSHYDLPIALGVLAAMNLIPKSEISEYLILGELSLDGSILGVSGVLPSAIGAVARGGGIICPSVNGKEASWSGISKIIAAKTILAIINHFKGIQIIAPPEISSFEAEEESRTIDFTDIVGQVHAKKALEIAAAGGHNVLMYGPPGTGKSMLASGISSILPKMTVQEILECSTIYSIAGMIQEGRLTSQRPYRAPHHSCSAAAMVGGGAGKRVKPGEISLAHNGVLFLDELPEFAGSVIESLRQPIETGEVLISRANAHIKFPANFQLIAAMNPCRCGYFPNPEKSCSKAPKCSSDYFGRISGPMMDRFDIQVEAEDINASQYNILKNHAQESSATILERVKQAREIQAKRFEGYSIRTNSQMNGQLLIEQAVPDNDGMSLLNDAANKFKMSMRSYNRILKVGRTIADLDGSNLVRKIHIAQAVSFRSSIKTL